MSSLQFSLGMGMKFQSFFSGNDFFVTGDDIFVNFSLGEGVIPGVFNSFVQFSRFESNDIS